MSSVSYAHICPNVLYVLCPYLDKCLLCSVSISAQMSSMSCVHIWPNVFYVLCQYLRWHAHVSPSKIALPSTQSGFFPISSLELRYSTVNSLKFSECINACRCPQQIQKVEPSAYSFRSLKSFHLFTSLYYLPIVSPSLTTYHHSHLKSWSIRDPLTYTLIVKTQMLLYTPDRCHVSWRIMPTCLWNEKFTLGIFLSAAAISTSFFTIC